MDARCLQGGSLFSAGAFVRDQQVRRAERADAGEGGLPDLAAVGDDHGLLPLLQHYPIDLRGIEVDDGEAGRGMDAAYPDERAIALDRLQEPRRECPQGCTAARLQRA